MDMIQISLVLMVVIIFGLVAVAGLFLKDKPEAPPEKKRGED